MIATWPSPDGGEEYALAFDHRRTNRVLIVPALFEEANRMRRMMAGVMRRLDGAGIDCFLPDLPGTNESLAPLSEQTVESWRRAVLAACDHFAATRVLTVRAGAILAPAGLAGWRYAPSGGDGTLKTLLRARILASREAGREENAEALLAQGRTGGLDLAGYALGPAMIAELEQSFLPESSQLRDIAQSSLGGGGLWLRAEPEYDPAQADALAAFVSLELSQ